MKYTDTKYHGTKKELRDYLEKVKATAMANVEEEFKPQLETAQQQALDDLGVTEYMNKYLPDMEKALKLLKVLLIDVQEKDAYVYRSGISRLALYITDVRQNLLDNLSLDQVKCVRTVQTAKSSALKDLNDSWNSVLYGIVGQSKKIKYICRDLEDVGFDLTEYYEKMLAKQNISVPSINVDYKSLGIK